MIKKILPNLIPIILAAANIILVMPAPAKAATAATDRKIVVYKDGVSESKQDELINASGVAVYKELEGTVEADVVEMSTADLEAFRKDSRVERVEDDTRAYALGQTLPWGVDRIDAERAQATASGAGVRVAILDSGIDLGHPDLQSQIRGGYNAITSGASYGDDNGHGTHVAGIVSAVNNSIGVLGVAPQTELYSVKVLSSSGMGQVSDIIEGIDWAIANNMQIINLSLATDTSVQSLHDAVKSANARGIVVVAAAGNDGGSVKYPAAYPEVIAVGAIDQTETLASWSSRGPELDILAPGAGIYSTYMGGIYKTMRGTSMAAPHVAGTAALILSKGNFTAGQVKTQLLNSAENLSGYSLVDAESAAALAVSQPIAPAPAAPTPVANPPAPQIIPYGPAGIGHGPGSLVNIQGTVWRITDDGASRQGFDSLEKFLSHRFNFSQVAVGNSADLDKTDIGLMPWGDGVLFNDNGTVYQISGGQKHGFISATIFLASGFKFENVLWGHPNAPAGAPIADFDKHLPGTFVLDAGTVFLVTGSGLRGVSSPEIFFSWGGKFSEIVPIFAADKQIYGVNLTARSV